MPESRVIPVEGDPGIRAAIRLLVGNLPAQACQHDNDEGESADLGQGGAFEPLKVVKPAPEYVGEGGRYT